MKLTVLSTVLLVKEYNMIFKHLSGFLQYCYNGNRNLGCEMNLSFFLVILYFIDNSKLPFLWLLVIIILKT